MKESIPNSVELIDSHLDDFFDEDDNIVVLHEIESEIIHRDIYIIKANEEISFNILLSCGMSALPMNVPQNIDSYELCEVMMLLPSDWNIEYDSFDDERNYWPFRIIKEIMTLPHSNNTWMGYGHTFQYEEKEEFAEGIGFNAILLADSIELSSEFTQIELTNDEVVNIYTLIPLYQEELEFKIQNGAEKLLERFDEFGIGEVVKVGRENVCKK